MSGHIEFNTPHGKSYRFEILYQYQCAKCDKRLENNEVVYYIDKPFDIFVHQECAPYYDYNKIFPHRNPMTMYRLNQQ